MLAAAVLPHPPLIVPALAAGAAPLIAPLLAACDRVIADLSACGPRTVVLIGTGARTVVHSLQAPDTLSGFGAPVPEAADSSPVSTAPGCPSAESDRKSAAGVQIESLPLSLAIGRWLLQRADLTTNVVLQEVATDTPTADCEQLGRTLAVETGPDAVWLALGDGSNRRGPRSPGHDDPRAAGFDAAVVAAFAAADPAAVLALDAGLAAELGAVGRAAWQVLAGAVAADPDRPRIDATVHYDDAPFGVEYLVADWRLDVTNLSES